MRAVEEKTILSTVNQAMRIFKQRWRTATPISRVQAADCSRRNQFEVHDSVEYKEDILRHLHIAKARELKDSKREVRLLATCVGNHFNHLFHLRTETLCR